MTQRGDDVVFLTVDEVARRWGLAPSTVYRMCRSRVLAHVRVGGGRKRRRVKIALEDVVAYERRHRIEASLNG